MVQIVVPVRHEAVRERLAVLARVVRDVLGGGGRRRDRGGGGEGRRDGRGARHLAASRIGATDRVALVDVRAARCAALSRWWRRRRGCRAIHRVATARSQIKVHLF